jgi:hypothetical protein
MTYWTNSLDGKKRITFRVEHRLSREDLIDALVSNASGQYHFDEVQNWTMGQVQIAVRQQLHSDGSEGNWTWPERINDRVATEWRLWAEHMIDHAYPGGVE